MKHYNAYFYNFYIYNAYFFLNIPVIIVNS